METHCSIVARQLVDRLTSWRFNPLPDQQNFNAVAFWYILMQSSNKFAISIHFLYFAEDAKLSADEQQNEQLAG